MLLAAVLVMRVNDPREARAPRAAPLEGTEATAL